MTNGTRRVQRRGSETLRPVYGLAGQSLSGCAAAPSKPRPCSVGLRLRSTRPTATFCWVALPLHPTHDHVLSGCACAPPDLRPAAPSDLRLNEVRKLTCGNNRSFAGAQDDKMHKLGAAGGSETQRRFHKPAGQSLSGCAAAPSNPRPCSVGLRCRSTQPTATFCRVALPLHPTYDS